MQMHRSERTGPLAWNDELPLDVDLLVVGGGFAGLATAIHVVAERSNTRIAIVERSPLAAPGAAFGACEPSHLLNVPAERMGALTDDPAGFLSWLSREVPGVYSEGAFVPRALYGAYLNELDRVSGAIPVRQLEALVARWPITTEQLGDAIQIDTDAYVRTLVFERGHVEVLVMAWMPGQRSPIHVYSPPLQPTRKYVEAAP